MQRVGKVCVEVTLTFSCLDCRKLEVEVGRVEVLAIDRVMRAWAGTSCRPRWKVVAKYSPSSQCAICLLLAAAAVLCWEGSWVCFLDLLSDGQKYLNGKENLKGTSSRVKKKTKRRESCAGEGWLGLWRQVSSVGALGNLALAAGQLFRVWGWRQHWIDAESCL